jgi:16S rRNA (cytidine1402-2'-O)-methyltransferase
MAGEGESGTLWVVATPIGNLDDLSPRALALLESVPIIAAEDTRVSSRLLAGRAERAEMVSLHEHNEGRVVDGLIDKLRAGTDIALVSDAGTPLISDPGYRLVAAAHDAGVPVRTVPGPCAATAALSIAGLATDRFWFEGFLPARTGARRKRLEALAGQPVTLVFYAPARDLPAVLEDMIAAFGPDRPATLARELTKLHETVRRDALQPLHDWITADPDQQRGEAVLVVVGTQAPPPEVDATALARELASELPPSRAAKLLARLTGLDRKEAWAEIERHKPAKS